MELARQREVARIESAKQSNRLFMTIVITLMNPRKAEDPPSLAEIQDYIENLEPILVKKSPGWIILDKNIKILFYVLLDLVYVCGSYKTMN